MASLLSPPAVIGQFAATRVQSSLRLGWRGLVVSHTVRGATHDHRVPPMRDHAVHLRLRGANHLACRLGGERLSGWIAPGAAIVSPARADMTWTWNRGCTTLDIFVEAALVDEAAAMMGLDGAGPTELRPAIGVHDAVFDGVGRMLARELASDVPAAPLAESAAIVLAGHLARRYRCGDGSAPAGNDPRATLSPGVLRRVRELVEERLDSPLTLADLAAAARLSRFHFARGFRASTGITPLQYVQQRRVARAKRLLAETGMPLIEIAIQSGFVSPEHFSNVFRRHEGMPPARWRRLRRA